jgi:hypothetical protein
MSASESLTSYEDDREGEGFRTPAIQAVVQREAGVRKPPMHEPAGRGQCYGDLNNPLFRRGGGTAAAVGTATPMCRRMAVSTERPVRGRAIDLP